MQQQSLEAMDHFQTTRICCKIIYLPISAILTPFFFKISGSGQYNVNTNQHHNKRQDMIPDTKQILKFATLKRAGKAWEMD